MMTVAELFEAMTGRFDSAAAAGMTKTFQWNITGDEAGVWAFQVINGVGQLIPGGVENPDTTFTTSSKDWIAIDVAFHMRHFGYELHICSKLGILFSWSLQANP